MRSLALVPAALLVLAGPAPADAPAATYRAEPVTLQNAESLLFGGTDADGGIDDWYVSNGVIEAIIDDVALQDDLPPGVPAPPRQNEAAPTGGNVLDLGLVGADNDQLSGLFTIGGLSLANFIEYDSVHASTTGASATVTVEGSLLGFDPIPPSQLRVVTEYTAAGSDPFLTMTTTVTNHSAEIAAGLGGFIDAVAWTSRAVVPFSPLRNRGFDHAALDFDNLALALELPAFSAGPGNVSPADGVLDPPSGRAAGEVAYGLLGVEVSRDPGTGDPPVVTPVNTLFGVSSNLVTAFGNLPAGNQLPPGASLVYERRLYVGSRNDVASVANPMLEELAGRLGFVTGTLSGDVDAADARDVAASVIATRTGGPPIAAFPDGTPLTHFRTDADGSFAGVVLPVGTYALEVRAPERDPVTVSGVVVAAGSDTAVPIPPLSALGTLRFAVREQVQGGSDPLVPARITVKGLSGTPDPRFRYDFEANLIQADQSREDLRPETFAGGPAQANIVYLADGTGEVQLRPGRYEVFATRGLEYTLQRAEITVRAGRSVSKTFRLRRVVDTAGAISADFHIHSARSLDSSATLLDRVGSFAGEGVEVMVSTDHDYHVDYAPVIAELGLGSLVTSIVGNEVTASLPNPPRYPDSYGHINAWPVPVLPLARRDGSIDEEYVAPNFIYSRLRRQGAQVIQYNHPRAGLSGLTSIGFFNNFGYDPALPIDVAPNDLLLDDDVTGSSGVPNPDGLRNIDFDAMEIANGTNVRRYLEVRDDWFSLLNQRNRPVSGGPVPFIVGTAVSDSHRVATDEAGYSRTFVGGSGDDPSALDVATFNANILAGNMTGSSGPFVEFWLEDETGARAGLGETFVPASSALSLAIRVQAAPWLPVDEVRIYANGSLERSFDASTAPAVQAGPKNPFSAGRKRIVRFDASVPVTVSRDTHFVVEAGAVLAPLAPVDEIVNKIQPGLRPVAFTNPIFVDLDGDGFDPPGLSATAAAARRARAADALDAEAREEIQHHLPIHKIRIPQRAADAARERHSGR
ncbi:MAG: CehA/McbA family metallohydrolase [Deltaproteobacteria bacterium]|nr:MAG: CehA/McbA family metallohydrolase [Deltaproteobacteria bacterium]